MSASATSGWHGNGLSQNSPVIREERRVDLVLEMMENFRKEGDAAAERFERVYRMVNLSDRV